MTQARLRELKKRSQGDGPPSVQARRTLANMRLPGESAASFVQRQLLDEDALDAAALARSARSEEDELSARLSAVMQDDGRTALARRRENIEALRLKDPTRS